MRTVAIAVLVLVAAAAPASGRDVTVEVLDDAVVQYRPELTGLETKEDHVVRRHGQLVERTLELPAAPPPRRIVATVRVQPVMGMADGRRRPNDPWTRVGNLTVVTEDESGRLVETELLRFTTAYGAPGLFEEDLTPLAPLLQGGATLRAWISTYSKRPAWLVSVTMRYTTEGIGARRPAFAGRVFLAPHVTAEAPKLSTQITVPPGLDPPRLRIISTGHATDGRGGNEFVTCTHVLRVDGREIARWRPWSERGGGLRRLNPWAGRSTLGGRDLRSSDFDRAGWHPGLPVQPLIVPAPELTPGRHAIELEIEGIRPKGPRTGEGVPPHGYWMVSATVVGDEAWPVEVEGTVEGE